MGRYYSVMEFQREAWGEYFNEIVQQQEIL